MLSFWYSERCTRAIKLTVIIGTCMVILTASKSLQLSTILSVFSLALGMLLHFIRMWSLKIKQHHPDKTSFQRLFLGIPIVGIVLLSLSLNAKDLISFLLLWVQLIGFIGIGFFLIATVEQRAKRNA